ncbi:hypothetical protein B0H21DRAFT_710905 [Amylocystis lapponica]|nr:hypothetical protein B0H21DRAFT_710905 [Amylocystis lapponica]
MTGAGRRVRAHIENEPSVRVIRQYQEVNTSQDLRHDMYHYKNDAADYRKLARNLNIEKAKLDSQIVGLQGQMTQMAQQQAQMEREYAARFQEQLDVTRNDARKAIEEELEAISRAVQQRDEQNRAELVAQLTQKEAEIVNLRQAFAEREKILQQTMEREREDEMAALTRRATTRFSTGTQGAQQSAGSRPRAAQAAAPAGAAPAVATPAGAAPPR